LRDCLEFEVMSDPYIAIPSTGKLKLKGVQDSKVDKKKKKKKKNKTKTGGEGDAEEFQDKSVMLRKLEEEDAQIMEEGNEEATLAGGREAKARAGVAIEDDNERINERVKTEAEKRFDEQRRKRLEERLKREGVKTHKQRVEELNRYLSGLSEHHDMPRIGPG